DCGGGGANHDSEEEKDPTLPRRPLRPWRLANRRARRHGGRLTQQEERGRDLRDAIASVLLEASLEQRADRRRQSRRQRTPIRIALQYRRERVRNVLAVKRA